MASVHPFLRDYASLLKDVVEAEIIRATEARIYPTHEHTTFPITFIIGCGRSGTTILGQCLGAHRNIAYLNEPQHMWFAGWPEGDIWSPWAWIRGGRLSLGAEDVTERHRTLITRIMGAALGGDRTHIVEKWPINTFRIPLLDALFPHARYILIQRDAHDVASSIEAAAKRDGTWWGAFDYKWRALVEFARADARFGSSFDLNAPTSHYERGLVEWRLSNEAAVAALEALDPARVLRIDYSDFIADAPGIGAVIRAFLGLPPCSFFNAMLTMEVRGPMHQRKAA